MWTRSAFRLLFLSLAGSSISFGRQAPGGSILHLRDFAENPLLAGKDFSSPDLRALRGFAVNPGLGFHREGAKHAKTTRRLSLVAALPLCAYLCSIFGLVRALGAAASSGND